MRGIDEARDAAKVDRIEPVAAMTVAEIESFVDRATFDGQLAALAACVCEKTLMYQISSPADPGQEPDPGVQAAIAAYAGSKRIEEGSMDKEVRSRSSVVEPPADVPEILPRAFLGQWVAWSSDGMRIIAASETSEEAERLAIATGEPEPILQRHCGRYRR